MSSAQEGWLVERMSSLSIGSKTLFEGEIVLLKKVQQEVDLVGSFGKLSLDQSRRSSCSYYGYSAKDGY